MRLGRILLGSRANGPGLRDVVWFSGCTLGCPGCVNRDLWSPSAGGVAPVEELVALFRARAGQVDGVTFSGGEPLQQPEALEALVSAASEVGHTVVLFTGHTPDEIGVCPTRSRIVGGCDLVVAGRWEAERATDGRGLRGSANQAVFSPTGRYGRFEGPIAELRLDGDRVVVTGVAAGKVGGWGVGD